MGRCRESPLSGLQGEEKVWVRAFNIHAPSRWGWLFSDYRGDQAQRGELLGPFLHYYYKQKPCPIPIKDIQYGFQRYCKQSGRVWLHTPVCLAPKFRTLLLKVWCGDPECGHHLGPDEKCGCSGPSPDLLGISLTSVR